MALPTLVYDGDCGICTKAVGFVERHLVPPTAPARRRTVIVAWQDADLAVLRLTQGECEEALQWVDVDGGISSGHRAVGRLLLRAGRWWRPLGHLALLPPTSWLAALVYRWVAANRYRLPGGTPACALPAHLRPGATAPR